MREPARTTEGGQDGLLVRGRGLSRPTLVDHPAVEPGPPAKAVVAVRRNTSRRSDKVDRLEWGCVVWPVGVVVDEGGEL